VKGGRGHENDAFCEGGRHENDAFCAGRVQKRRILCRAGGKKPTYSVQGGRICVRKGGIENAYPLSRAHLRPQKGVLKKHTPYLGRICVCVSVFLSISARLGVPKVCVKGGRGGRKTHLAVAVAASL